MSRVIRAGSPFTNVRANWGEGYRSASLYNDEPTDAAWMVGFYWGQAGTQYIAVKANYWCVRGPATADQY